MNAESIKALWGEELYSVFADHINEDGWLTADWGKIIEGEIPRFDEHYNDNPLYQETYSRMYLLDFQESDCGNLIRPLTL